jgi:2,3-bisphosphoglycerate-independent phosphoglycerate mutase
MSDVKEILHQILNDEKLLKSRAFRDKIYTDEPIIRTASQIPRPRTPEKIKEMKGACLHSRSLLEDLCLAVLHSGQIHGGLR